MFIKVVTVAVFAAVIAPIGAYSQTIAQIGGPAELPPTSYKGLQYVDSRGCVFMRVESSGAARWYPRVTAARKPVCNQAKPAASVVAEETPAPKVMAEPVVLAAPAPKIKNAPMETIASKMMPVAVAKPMTIAPAPRQVAVAPKVETPRVEAVAATGPSRGKIGCYASAPVAQLVRLNDGGTAVMCTRGDGTSVGWRPPIYPAGSAPGIALRSSDVAQQVAGAAGPSPSTAKQQQAVPQGYKLAWNDDRLNLKRGVGTAAGQAAQDEIWTREVPAQLVAKVVSTKPATRSKVTVSSKGTVKPAASGRSFIQIGTFGVASNASGAASRLKALGLPVAHSKIVRGGKALQIVLAGPFGSPAQAQAALSQARQAGFGDAFLR